MDKELISIGKTAKLLGISIDTLRRWDNSGKFNSVRIGTKGKRYYKKSDIDLYLNDQLAIARKWALSDLGYEPQSEYFCKTRDIFQARLEHFQSDLVKNIDMNFASLISAIIGEIGNNSFDHNLGNWPDILGVYFGYSLSQKKVVLADRGLGILSTLRKILPELSNHKEALRVAFTEIVSGRAPESRGNGLKFVRNVVIKNPITLFFQTGNAVLNLNQNDIDVIIEEADESMHGCLAVIQY
ncbi:MAG: hypothetical protein ACD_19C00176G0051 [uncultured bacterium]|nr:MAG: hypothetical protein ACD_19C00176G0051 [uncultured bacterium]